MESNYPPRWGRKALHMRRKRKMRLPMPRNRKGIQKKLKQLQKIIPGGNEMDNAETLFQNTANYMSLLECQVIVLRTVISALNAVGNSEDSSFA